MTTDGTPEAGGVIRLDSEAERKHQHWRATTTGLLWNALSMEDQAEKGHYLEKGRPNIVKRVRRDLDLLIDTRDAGFLQDLKAILDDAMKLDMEISKQVAKVSWDFGDSKPRLLFDPEGMELERGEMPVKAGTEALVVMAPALKKRGKSSGEGFNVENTLLPMVVSCS